MQLSAMNRGGEQREEIFDKLLQGDGTEREGEGMDGVNSWRYGEGGGGRPDVDIFTPSGEVTEKSVRRGEDTCLIFFFLRALGICMFL